MSRPGIEEKVADASGLDAQQVIKLKKKQIRKKYNSIPILNEHVFVGGDLHLPDVK